MDRITPKDSKKEMLLEYIIKEYIKNPEPIGSEYLKLQLNIQISAATIRNYLKKMVESGELAQPHSSSGRVPTEQALIRYWQKKLLPLKPVNVAKIETLKQSAKESKLFCVVKFYKPNRLKEIINAHNRYIILVFEVGECVVGYSKLMERFCQELVGMEIEDILKLTLNVKALELSNKLEELLKSAPIEQEGTLELISQAAESGINEEIIIDAIKGSLIDRIAEGLYFEHIVPRGYLGIKQGIKITGNDAKMFFLGRLISDFEEFYRRIDE